MGYLLLCILEGHLFSRIVVVPAVAAAAVFAGAPAAASLMKYRLVSLRTMIRASMVKKRSENKNNNTRGWTKAFFLIEECLGLESVRRRASYPDRNSSSSEPIMWAAAAHIMPKCERYYVVPKRALLGVLGFEFRGSVSTWLKCNTYILYVQKYVQKFGFVLPTGYGSLINFSLRCSSTYCTYKSVDHQ